MTSQLEAQLTDALTRRASTVPTEVLDRLRATRYRPRTRRLGPPMTVLTGAAAAGTAASIALVGGASPAFAGWTATPSSGSGSQLISAEASCQQRLADMPGASDSSGWRPVITDVRGPWSVVVYQGGASYASCFTGPDLTLVNRTSMNGSSMSVSGFNGRSAGSSSRTASIQGADTGSGYIEHHSVAHLSSTNDGAYTLVEGTIASGVTSVRLLRDDGTDVDATTADGWFVAWWPGGQSVTSANVTTSDGTTSQSLTMPAPPQQARTGSCGGEAQTATEPGSGPGTCGGSAPDVPGGAPAPPPGSTSGSGSGTSPSGQAG